MLSSTLSLLNDATIGSHPIIARLMKVFYNERPPQPRYPASWPVNKVFDLIESKGDNDQLDLSALSCKLPTLLALVTFMRSSELA